MFTYLVKSQFLLFLLISSGSFAQYTTEWTAVIGGTEGDFVYDLAYAPDGRIIAAGKSSSAEITGYHDRSDAWLTQLSSAGEVLWQRCYGSDEDDGFNSVIVTPAGNYLAAGYTYAANGDVTEHFGSNDVWVVAVNTSGELLWQRSYGDISVERAVEITPAGDGNYLILCTTTASGPDHILYDFQDEYLLYKIDPSGNIIWQKTYGGSSFEYPDAIAVNEDMEIVMCGAAMSDDGDVSDHTFFGGEDAWFLKTDAEGNMLTSNCEGKLNSEYFRDVLPADDGGYFVLSTYLLGPESCNEEGEYDFQFNKTNAVGDIEWQTCYGGLGYDFIGKIAPDVEGYFLGGISKSSLPGYHGAGEYDFYIVKVNEAGELLWHYCYGGTGLEGNGFDLESDNMGGFVFGGSTESTDGDITTPLGSTDGLVMKITCVGTAEIATGDATEICVADTVIINTPFIEGASWQWYKDGIIIPGATDTSLICFTAGEYWVEVTSPAYCKKFSESIVITDTCLMEYPERIPYGIYPNPAAGSFIVECLDGVSCGKIFDISIYDMHGVLVYTINNRDTNSPTKLDMALKQGMYIMQIREENNKTYHLPVMISY